MQNKREREREKRKRRRRFSSSLKLASSSSSSSSSPPPVAERRHGKINKEARPPPPSTWPEAARRVGRRRRPVGVEGREGGGRGGRLEEQLGSSHSGAQVAEQSDYNEKVLFESLISIRLRSLGSRTEWVVLWRKVEEATRV
ncbi:hypothetical protein EYF80_061026 [Liparis tanakae]|uniref:Uncharacterized protein n=1 Tax=Liparis tanakae TaxID=230148 RepID=A0A4Z2EIP9_9TELE|nr:hypothetical protein EYF80_061026 [Liparis tanakae]